MSSSQDLSLDERTRFKNSVSKRAHPWSAHEKKAYTRLMSGMIKNHLLNRKLKFMTLTTSSSTGEGLSPEQRKELVQHSWRKLYKLIKDKYRFDSYFKVVTTEGYGVIHILFEGDYIPWEWIMYQWQRIHGSPFIYIEKVYGTPYDYANYCINQYVAGHGVSFAYNASQNWCYRGYLRDMEEVRNECKDYAHPMYTHGNVWYYVNTEKFVSAWYQHLANKFITQRDFALNPVPFYIGGTEFSGSNDCEVWNGEIGEFDINVGL